MLWLCSFTLRALIFTLKWSAIGMAVATVLTFYVIFVVLVGPVIYYLNTYGED